MQDNSNVEKDPYYHVLAYLYERRFELSSFSLETVFPEEHRKFYDKICVELGDYHYITNDTAKPTNIRYAPLRITLLGIDYFEEKYLQK
ncbi:MAG: hypothetical protein ACOVQA_04775 [Thermoflexibacteraceae bacterium]|jgi:hypothetical protein